MRVVDGDTVRLELDLGLHIFRTENCRLAGINAPALPTEQGRAARQFLLDTLAGCHDLRFESKMLDKYGRPLGFLSNGDDLSINQRMIAAGHAVVMR